MTNKKLLEKCIGKNKSFIINDSKEISVNKNNKKSLLKWKILKVTHNQDGSCTFLLNDLGIKETFRFKNGVNKNY